MARGRTMRRLLEQAEGMPYGFARTATVEEAVRAADEAQDLDAAFEARMELAQAAVHGGEPQKALVAVTWCLGQLDAHPGRFEEHGTYWALKWLPPMLLDRPEIPLEEVERVIGEAERRYTAAGEGADAVAKLRWTILRRTGRLDEATEAYRAWRLLPRSEYSDCRACDLSAEVEFALAQGEPERALDVARPLLAGRVSCLEEPGAVIGDLLGPVHDLGRAEEAERLHTWGLRLVRGNPSLVAAQAQHALHLLRTGRLPEAFGLVAELVDVCDRGLFRVSDRITAIAAASAITAAWSEAGHGPLPRGLGDRPPAPAELAAVLAADARETAAAFDRRNGTTRVSDDVARLLAVRPATAVPSAPAPTEQPTVDVPLDAAGLLQRAREPRGSAEQRLTAAEHALAAALEEDDAAAIGRARRTVGEALLRLRSLAEGAAALDEAALQLGADPDEQVLALLTRARVAVGLTGDTEDPTARHCLERARAAAERSADRDLARGLVRLLEAEWAVLELGEDAGEEASEVGMAEFSEARSLLAGHPDDIQDAWNTEAFARTVVGDLTGALAAATASWEHAQRSGKAVDRRAAAEVLLPLLGERGELDRVVEVLAAAERAEAELGDFLEAAKAAGSRTELLGELERHEEALAAAWSAVDHCGLAGDRTAAAWARLAVARAHRVLEQDQSAFDLLSELVEQAAEDGDRELEGAVALDLALLHGEFGYVDDALLSGERALRCFGREDAEARCKVLRTLARAHEARGDMKEALAAGESFLAELPRVEDEDLVARFREDHADRLVRAGQPDRALPLYDAARATYVAAGAVEDVAVLDLDRARALAGMRFTPDAWRVAGEVLAVAEREGLAALRADTLWFLATILEPDAGRFDAALRAYEEAGAPPEQLAELAAQRDAALGAGRSRWRRR